MKNKKLDVEIPERIFSKSVQGFLKIFPKWNIMDETVCINT